MKRLHFFSLAIPLACIALRLAASPTLPLWNSAAPFPKAAELARLEGVRFHVIKRYEPAADGYRFLHGVALAWHRDRLYASIGHNQGGENTETEEARFTVSNDGGKTWSAVATMDAGLEPGLGVSHGVFHAHGGKLWAFHGAYTGTMKQVHTRAYLLDDATGKWLPRAPSSKVASGPCRSRCAWTTAIGSWRAPASEIATRPPSPSAAAGIS